MRIPALRVRQWLNIWDEYSFDSEERQSKPLPYFLVTTIPAPILRRLSGVREREEVGPRSSDEGIQRRHNIERSQEISRFVKSGYPWASLSKAQQHEFLELRKPGWLPTSVVANLVSEDTIRSGIRADPRDVVRVEQTDSDSMVMLTLPEGCDAPTWRPSSQHLKPVEIVDGQHRLFAFEEDEDFDGDFELPVVIFLDLDISWQAYLFWSINISPKRINPSMAYDLYPLLRTASWLEPVEGPLAYRESRAQELAEALWSHQESPWRNRISMLGRQQGKVTQAAFVRSLTMSFVKSAAAARRTGIGGFFASTQSSDPSAVLGWTRAQQAAYLIELWKQLSDTISQRSDEWAEHLRRDTPEESLDTLDPAFSGRFSILASDHGVRGFLHVVNDMSYCSRHLVPFGSWQRSRIADATDLEEVSEALSELRQLAELQDFIALLAEAIASFDWRSAVTPNLPVEVEAFQSRYRAGSGYKQVRLQLLRHLESSSVDKISTAAAYISQALGYHEE